MYGSLFLGACEIADIAPLSPILWWENDNPRPTEIGKHGRAKTGVPEEAWQMSNGPLFILRKGGIRFIM